MKEKDIIKCKEYVYPDSYAYVVRDRKTNKILVSEWSEKDAEEKLNKIINKYNIWTKNKK